MLFPLTSAERSLAFRWIAANMLAWTVAIGIYKFLPFRSLPAWIACGAIVGTAQWLVLPRRLRLMPLWIAGTWIAWAVGSWVGNAFGFLGPNEYAAGLAGGTLAGVAQSGVLWRQVSRPALWIPWTIFSSTLGLVTASHVGYSVIASRETAAYAYYAAGAAGGAVIGAASALPLVAMLRHPKPRHDAV